MNDGLLEELLHEGEGSSLDFKREQYPFSGATDEDKGELLKDILAFANAWRRDTAYILIGVQEVRGGRSNPLGVTQHLSDNDLQQFVNTKTNRPIEFSYLAYDFRGTQLGIVQVPVQRRPFYLLKDFGKLRKEQVYLRRGSSTDVATLDEITEMGDANSIRAGRAPTFDFRLLEWVSKEPFADVPTLVTLVLDDSVIERPPAVRQLFPDLYNKPEGEYLDEVVEYVFKNNYFQPVGFWLKNTSTEAAKSVQASIVVPKQPGMRVTDNGPEVPSRSRMHLRSSLFHQRPGNDPVPDLEEHFDHWNITIPFDLLNPKADLRSTSPIWLGAQQRCAVEFSYKIFAEGLANPAEGVLKLVVEPTSRLMTSQDLASLLERR